MEAASRRSALEEFIRWSADAEQVMVHALERLSGGAVQENWRVDVTIEGGSWRGRHLLVARSDAPSAIAESHSRVDEFRILKAVHRAGVSVPEPLWVCADPGVLGRRFYIVRWVPGYAAGHRMVRDPAPAGSAEALAGRLGQELARIHALTPANAPDLDFLPRPQPTSAMERVARYRRHLDELSDVHPALEWGLRWCETHAPESEELVLVHRDFRTGNYMVDDSGLTAILDWEFAGWGDPAEDLAWFCARCWRFGAYDNEAGGIAPREPFYRAYEQASGRRVDPAAVHFWEVMAHVRWAAIALHQCERHITGGEHSLELALTGRIAGECELEVLLLTDRGFEDPHVA
ncbi:MAG: phosphotransferase family protein [Gammaproteobacteria bacterium]|nr:phosphotransferase family protein [Gammaproteobacteria bacterium]NIR84498.1 phosphotransferase family protein [Gammaproteobacteria bacterium]NIR90401.1 phosphotransferase family protein [Gammaproteobacteria bacterium]NIU05549.1 phosphotransferase family protein [Gammaproteobacteria bacterium]NIV52688.1 phosphotransferase [Gammaproteobacteria bacterium]